MSRLTLLDDMPSKTELEFCVVVACQSVHAQRIGFLQDTFRPRNGPESSLVYGQLRVDNVAHELELRVPHGVHNGQYDGARLVQVRLSQLQYGGNIFRASVVCFRPVQCGQILWQH